MRPSEQNARKMAYRRRYYEKHRVSLCKKRLDDETFLCVERAQVACPEAVEQYLLRYPFEQYGDRLIRSVLFQNGVYSSHAAYADCYDSGMLAYLYSIHRCAAMSYDHVVPYLRKMIRVYMICALVVYRDAENLCRANNFREVRLDAEVNGRCY